MNSFVLHWPVIFRATLYFLIAALPAIISALDGIVKGDATAMPDGYWWLATVTALYQGLVAIRAYYDGSSERKRIEIEKVELERVAAQKQAFKQSQVD